MQHQHVDHLVETSGFVVGVSYSYILAIPLQALTLSVRRDMNRLSIADDVSLAKSRFPLRAHVIELLARRNESFRELCRDFATADQLCQTLTGCADPSNAVQHAEFVQLVEDLRGEIADAIANASVVPLSTEIIRSVLGMSDEVWE
ncbi:hypothetical protein HFO72_31085 [Rhizobium laguerreae]|uniref:hypothetical protein n=1 Tax=Rhizobium laguerreae TaxID=1076926 RepID=UPI001C919CF2|nr:hypothetical protein [Rhizobium laguerreae]MBY3095185.1 hypothetical protein [Rhizobium laguerreae]